MVVRQRHTRHGRRVIDPAITAWLSAFFVTSCIEAPLYAVACRSRQSPRPMRWPSVVVVALGASAITHPPLWFGLIWLDQTHLPNDLEWTVSVAVAELAVVAVEGAWLRLWRVPFAWRWAFGVNAASVAVGYTLRALVG